MNEFQFQPKLSSSLMLMGSRNLLQNLLQNCLPNHNSSNQCSICNIILPTTITDKEFTAVGFTFDKDKQFLLKFYQTFNLEFLLPKNEEVEIIQYCESCNKELIKIQELDQTVQELNQLINELQNNLMTVLVKSRIKTSVLIDEGDGIKVVTDASITQFIKDSRKCKQDLPTSKSCDEKVIDDSRRIKLEPRRSGRINRSRNTTTNTTFEPANSFGIVEMQKLNLIQDAQKQDLYPDVELAELEIKLERIDVDNLDFDLASNNNSNMLDNLDLTSLEPSCSESDFEPSRSCNKKRKYKQQNKKKGQTLRKKKDIVKRNSRISQPVLSKNSLIPNASSEHFSCIYGCKIWPITTKLVQNRHHYKYHKEIHLKINQFCCALCFETEEMLTNHLCLYQKKSSSPKIPVHKESKSTRKFTCEVCGIVYKTLHNLKNHMYEHEQPSKTGFLCKICGVLFDKPFQLKYHLRYVHGNGKDYKNKICPHCGKLITNIRTYRFHLYKQHKEEYLKDKPFYCKICHHVFKTQQELDKDYESHRKCTYCDYRFIDKRKLSEHENTHTGFQPHQCTICGKRFKQSVNLTQHMKIHTGERPYHCEICPERIGFFRKSELDKHNQKYHLLFQQALL